MKRALVAGGAGFVGSHFCERLMADGMHVTCVDSLLTGNRGNIKSLEGTRLFQFLEHDVSSPIQLQGPFDYVAHLASPASPRDYARHPIETLRAGSSGTFHLLDLALKNRATFLLASTSEVYGDPKVNPQPETYWGNVNPVGPRSVYDEAKRFSEAAAAAYARSHSLDVKIARIFNTYGPRMKVSDGRALPAFISSALRGEPLPVYGDGSQTRSLCYVDDTVEGLHRLLTLPQAAPAGTAREPVVVNIGNPYEITMLELARGVIAATGSDSKIAFEPLPVDDPLVRKPDISRARKLLGWEPKVSLSEGVRRMVDYFRQVMPAR